MGWSLVCPAVVILLLMTIAPTIYLLNATNSDWLVADIRVQDGEPYSLITTNRVLKTDSSPITVIPDQDGVLHIDVVVERGGIAMLSR